MNDPYEVIPFRHPIDANARVPGSKSYTNRYLVIAALAAGRSTLRGVLLSDDTEAMLDCLARLGIETTVDRTDGTTVVEGCGGRIPRAEAELDVRQTGTTARFITPMVALGRGRFVIDGHPQMRGRPMQELVGALAQLGGRIEGSALPLTVIGGSNAESPIIRVAGDVSSQFLSGLLLSGPYFPGGMRAINVASS